MRAVLLALLLVGSLVAHAGATPITMTFTDPGFNPMPNGQNHPDGGNTGSIGGRPFTNALFVITAISDTKNRVTVPGPGADRGFFLDNLSASISIAELGTFDFITPTRVVLTASPNVVGGTVTFSRSDPTTPFEIYGALTTMPLQRWDMLSSIGPQRGVTETSYTDTTVAPVLTSGGMLVFNRPERRITFNVAEFRATVRPGAPTVAVAEPGTLMVAVSGLGLLAACALRRRRA